MRSYERNIAVNLWWRHGLQVNFSSCSLPLNTTIKNLEFIGFGALTDAQNKLIRYVVKPLKLNGVLEET